MEWGEPAEDGEARYGTDTKPHVHRLNPVKVRNHGRKDLHSYPGRPDCMSEGSQELAEAISPKGHHKEVEHAQNAENTGQLSIGFQYVPLC